MEVSQSKHWKCTVENRMIKQSWWRRPIEPFMCVSIIVSACNSLNAKYTMLCIHFIIELFTSLENTFYPHKSQYCRLPIVCLCRLRIHKWTPTMRDTRSTTSYLLVIGNVPPPAASLHPDPLLPEDLQWAHSPGCPPPIQGRRSAQS